jgi:hypothetical protein
MATTIEDIHYEEMLSERHFEAVMKNAALEQCIYIFVEGESEEATFQMLLEDCGLDFKENGIVIANYNGIGNLKHAVRLIRKTLSHDRPIIVTYDDDLEGKRISTHLNVPLITAFKVPQQAVVTYSDGSVGGSFEEVFSPLCFIEACFQGQILEPSFPGRQSAFSSSFDKNKPWFPQLAKFVESNGRKASSINKVRLAEQMADSCDPVPATFIKLAEVALELRASNPVRHPDNVEC